MVCQIMELLNGCMCCCGWLRRSGLPPIGKIAAILFVCTLLGREVACLSFNDRLTKMLKGSSQHGRKVPRWNPDPETRMRVRRALEDTTFPTDDYGDNVNGVSPQQFENNDPSENCSENTKYQIRDIYEAAYRGPVCDIVDARGRSDQLLDLKNCVIVNGFVHLVFMHDLTEEDLKKYRFPKLRVITDYLLVFRMFNLRTLRYMFPNLAVIGGRELFKDYALVLYENPNLKEIGLGSLQFINRGGVRVQKNPMLCYLSTINWERLGRYSKNSKLPSKMTTFLQNREEGQCVDQCGDNAGCDKDGNRGLCWGFNLCQKKICPSQCQYSCLEDLSCGCHNQCLAGCTRKNDPTACIACRDKYFNGTCLSECPDGKFLIFGWHCIEKEECQRVGWTFYKNECLSDCPIGYKVKRTNCMDVCTKCTSDCGRVCTEDRTITDVESLKGVIGCSEIDGALTINIKGGSEVVERLDEGLKHLKVIGTLIVRRSFPLITLSFLKNIRRITGKGMEQEIYSVYILENQNLKELWNFTEQKTVIDAGKAFFHFNPRLCLSEVHKIERLTPGIEDNKDISDTTNGDKAICVFVPIKVLEILIYQEPLVYIWWENFVMKDERTLIGYQVFYKESPLQNAKKNEGVDACRLNSWTIVDKTKSEDAGQFYPLDNSTNNNSYFDPGKTSKLLSHLKSYTQYAFYIQAYTTSTAESGAASEIQYFMTKPAQPSQPRNLHTIGTTTSSIDIEWDPPASPNGIITHYIVEWLRQEEEDLPSVRAVDTCRRRYGKDASEPSTTKPSDTDTSKVDESASATECICECEQDQITKQAEIEVQESSNFENYLQNNVFFGKPEYDQVFDAGPNLLDYEDSSPNASRYRRSIVKRSADSVNISSIVNSTTASTGVFPYTVNVTTENETTLAPEGPRFKKFRKVVHGQTKTTLTELHHYSEYNIQVYACNNASDPRSKNDSTYKIKDEIPPPFQLPRVHKSKYVKCSIEAMTVKRTAPNRTVDVIPPESVESVIQNKGTSEETTTLYWMMPTDPNAYVRSFMIQIVNAEDRNGKAVTEYCAHVNSSVQDLMSYNFSLHPLGAGNYLAKIRPITLAGEGNWTAPVAFEVKDTSKSDSQTIIIVTVVIAFFIVVLVVIVVVCMKMRKKPMDMHGTYADYNPDYQRYIYIADEYEIDTEKVTILEEIGHGNFGKVFAGIARSIVKGEEETKVAIKRLHENALPARRFEFLKEASIMKAFNAHHVVRLLGVISKTGDPMVIMEFMEKGDLKCFLRSRRDNAEENSQHLPAPSLQEKLQMAAEIADGMAYLAAYKFVHRDLAARNCLVNGEGTVKIGDFGLTRDIYETDYYRKESRGFLPIRWMAPESLKDGIFDSRSDVWSYGVVLWELATLAEQPYHGLPHDEVTKFVIDGGYMEKPRNCPKRLYDLMTICWQYNPKMRPVFLEIVQELDRDVNDEFKEVCFYGKHDQVSSAEEDDGQFLVQHENSDGADIVYPRNDNHLGPSSCKGFSENNILPPGWNAGDHAFKTQKNSVKSGRLSTTPPKTENEEKMGLLAPELPPSSRILESPNTTTTTAPTTPASCGDRRTMGNRYSSESLYENFDDDVRLSKSKDPNLRDSGAFLSTSRNPKSGDKDPLEFYKHLNGGHKHTKDWDLESGVDDSSTVSPSNPPTPTEMHAALPSEGENDDSIPFLMSATTSSSC